MTDEKPKGPRRGLPVVLADQFTELVADLVPAGHVYTPAQRARFDSLYRELSRLDEQRLL